MAYLNKLQTKIWMAKLLSLLAGAVYFIQSIYDAHFLDVTMDEGTYLMKGHLFVTGVYKPFQLYGPWTNKMPLSYTIPGLAQTVFSPGLRTGRYFAVFLSMLIIFGMWMLTRRLRGHWWAAGIVWVMALNAGNITIYSRALSQGIVACMLVWVLMLILGENRRIWHTTLGALLATLIVFVRQNMAPVPVFVVLFIFWVYGQKHGLYALTITGIVFIGFHLLYWPQILILWLGYLPDPLKNLVRILLTNGGRKTTQYEAYGLTIYGFIPKLFVFFEALRMNFAAIIGLLTMWIFWPRRKEWKSDLDYKTSVFLSSLILLLIAMHFWVTFLEGDCLYCFNGYLAFFMPAALLLIAIAAPRWKRKSGWLPQTLALLIIIISCAGIAFGSYQILDDFLLNLPVPRMQNMHILPGTAVLWTSLRNKFGWSYEALQQAVPAAAGLMTGILFVGSSMVLFNKRGHTSPGFAMMIVFLLTGILLSPLKILGGGKFADYCSSDVLVSHEAVGKHVAELIPPGAIIYWQNDVSPLPLLYLPGREIYPPQLNHAYSFRVGGDPDIMYQNGLWNEALQERWIEEADYLLIAEQYVPSFNSMENFALMTDELSPTGKTLPCRDRSIIHIYKRIK